MDKDFIIRLALHLPLEDRVELIEALKQSLDDEPVDPSIEQACIELAEARLKEYEEGKVQSIPWEEVKARLFRSSR